MSKLFERILYNQPNGFMKDKVSNVLTGFGKGQSAQYSLMIVIEKWKRAQGPRHQGNIGSHAHPLPPLFCLVKKKKEFQNY